MIDDGFAESMDFSRMEVISTLLADDLSQYDWLPDSVYSSPADIIITYKKGEDAYFKYHWSEQFIAVINRNGEINRRILQLRQKQRY